MLEACGAHSGHKSSQMYGNCFKFPDNNCHEKGNKLRMWKDCNQFYGPIEKVSTTTAVSYRRKTDLNI